MQSVGASNIAFMNLVLTRALVTALGFGRHMWNIRALNLLNERNLRVSLPPAYVDQFRAAINHFR